MWERFREETGDALASEWLDRIARFGFVAKGAVFGTVGVMAILSVLGATADDPDVTGAFEALGDSPATGVLLVVLAVGLIAYTIWRFLQAFADLEGEGGGARGLFKRAAYFAIGAIYAGFAIYAVAILLGMDGTGEGAEDWTAMALALPGGVYAVGLFGLIVGVVGLNEIFFGLSGRYREEYRQRRMHPVERVAARGAGWYGHVSRGLIYCLIGFFLIRAAVRFDPDEAHGLKEAFSTLAEQPYGIWLVGAAAVGWVAFGLYCLAIAAHGELPNEEMASHGGLEDV